MVIAILVAAGVVCLFLPKLAELRGLQRKQAALEHDNRRLDQATRELADKRERFASDADFVERTARESGLVKPGDTVFRFREDDPNRNASARTTP